MAITDATAPLPAGLTTEEFRLRPIVADDAAMDYAAVVETREYLRLWEQSAWPDDDFTVEANREDLEDLQQRHNDRRAYTYTVLDPSGGECLGCVYVFPATAAFLTRATVTQIGLDAWADVDAVVYFWVRRSHMATGMDERLLAELRRWFTGAWGLDCTVYVTNEQFTHQVHLIGRTDLVLKFEFVEPDKAGTYLAFG